VNWGRLENGVSIAKRRPESLEFAIISSHEGPNFMFWNSPSAALGEPVDRVVSASFGAVWTLDPTIFNVSGESTQYPRVLPALQSNANLQLIMPSRGVLDDFSHLNNTGLSVPIVSSSRPSLPPLVTSLLEPPAQLAGWRGGGLALLDVIISDCPGAARAHCMWSSRK